MTTIYSTTYADGWVELDSDTYLIGAFWLDGFPVIEDEEERSMHGRGPDGRRSPIYDYRDGGLGQIQWVNATHDKAAVLCCDGGWKEGGTWHLWISAGAGTRPYEVPWRSAPRVRAGDHSGWQDVKEEARQLALAHLGIRPLPEPEVQPEVESYVEEAPVFPMAPQRPRGFLERLLGS